MRHKSAQHVNVNATALLLLNFKHFPKTTAATKVYIFLRLRDTNVVGVPCVSFRQRKSLHTET